MSDSARFTWMLDLAARIGDHATLGVLPVITEFPTIRTQGALFEQQVDKLLKAVAGHNGKSGLAVYVRMPHTEREPDTQASLRTFFVTEITVLEFGTYNAASTGYAPAGVGLHGDDAAETLAVHLENWRDHGIADAARVRTLITDHQGWIPPELREKQMTDVVVNAFQIEALAVLDLPDRCYVPRISFAAGDATLVTATAGATIRYTLDGSYPSTTDTAYSAPVAVSPGDVVRAIARKTGLADSDIAREVAP